MAYDNSILRPRASIRRVVRADRAAGHANSGWTGSLAQKQETAGARRGYLKANMKRGKKKQKLIGRVKRSAAILLASR